MRFAIASLIFASLVFYSYWSIQSLFLILASILLNYLLGRLLWRFRFAWLLGVGVGVNLLILSYFKYSSFLLANLNGLFGLSFSVHQVVLPLAISFFTFQQIDFLVDTYRGRVEKLNFLEQCLFVVFFPHLIAGPIISYNVIIPQFRLKEVFGVQYRNLAAGFVLFVIGLFKKVVIADGLSAWVSRGYLNPEGITFFEAWGVAISYAFQLYFDFSGYSEMAIGLARMFNITIPVNFNSPYKATTVTEFWRRWHMTLSTWFNHHVYTPLLTGTRRWGWFSIGFSLLFTFFLMGLWHGASWKCVVFGLLNGLAVFGEALTRKWRKRIAKMAPSLASAAFGVVYTFAFWCVALVFFRASAMADAWNVLKGMFLVNGYTLSWNVLFPGCKVRYPLLMLVWLFVLFAPSTLEFLKSRFTFGRAYATAVGLAFAVSLIYFNRTSTFLYFQF